MYLQIRFLKAGIRSYRSILIMKAILFSNSLNVLQRSMELIRTVLMEQI